MRAELEDIGAGSSDASATGGADRVKAERIPSPISVPMSGEVIDLTDD